MFNSAGTRRFICLTFPINGLKCKALSHHCPLPPFFPPILQWKWQSLAQLGCLSFWNASPRLAVVCAWHPFIPSDTSTRLGWHHLSYVKMAQRSGSAWNLNTPLLAVMLRRHCAVSPPPSWLEVNYSDVWLMRRARSACKWSAEPLGGRVSHRNANGVTCVRVVDANFTRHHL